MTEELLSWEDALPEEGAVASPPTAPAQQCASCSAALKAGARFCHSCGVSTEGYARVVAHQVSVGAIVGRLVGFFCIMMLALLLYLLGSCVGSERGAGMGFYGSMLDLGALFMAGLAILFLIAGVEK